MSFDSSLRTLLRMNKNPEEVLAYQTFKETIDKILEIIAVDGGAESSEKNHNDEVAIVAEDDFGASETRTVMCSEGQP